MTLTYRNDVSIAEIAVYVPSLAVAILLVVRHGFGRNAGWIFLITFCLARIIGSAMSLAAITNPTSSSLLTGASILQNVGFSPLELACISLLSRLVENINRTHQTFVKTRMLKLIETIITVGLIVGIVGGVNAADTYQKTGVYSPTSLTKAGTALLVASFILLVIATILTSFSVSHAEHGEKRILMAIAISLPFLAIRLAYSCMATFSHDHNFSMISTTHKGVTYLLCIALIEEFIVAVTLMSIGLTLNKVPKDNERYAVGHQAIPTSSDSSRPMGIQQMKAGGGDNRALRIAKKTIIGRIVMSFVPENRDQDVEMQGNNYIRK